MASINGRTLGSPNKDLSKKRKYLMGRKRREGREREGMGWGEVGRWGGGRR